MQTFQAIQDAGDIRYSAKLTEDGDSCFEVVTMFRPGHDLVYIHNAEFPTRYLGGASRSGYVHAMLVSVLAERNRRAAQ